MISIIDYGVGNLGSLLNIHKRIGLEAQIANTDQQIRQSTHLILPGVGSFDTAMRKLDDSRLREALEESVLVRKTPTLGICLGMQMMMESSEEGNSQGLGWVKGKARRFQVPNNVKIPHMGWNKVRVARENSLIERNMDSRYYFVHSYFVDCSDAEDVIATTEHSGDFVSAFQRDNVYGVQFHPEKSHSYGKILLTKFSEI
jgi:imidazole glycerol-phosphate synthase subunit HisH